MSGYLSIFLNTDIVYIPGCFFSGNDVTVEEFENLAMNIFVPGLMLYMVFILYKLKQESNAGGFGFFVIFMSLGMGIVGYVAKSVIQMLVQV